MYEAEYLQQKAKINYPSIFEMNMNLVVARKGSNDQVLRRQTWALLLAKNICITPVGIQLQWGKPIQYLMLALGGASGSWEAIQDRIDVMAASKKASRR
ncbi:uncharacterized protein N7515_005753 [Penicillium bovifimosum]|uniref:Uncharacterized protein n=1 Tax=Penicillium bovifimosum TaxID=126998 RepID=A0A9W9GUZ5_9EURO|nr:uncharacterized protein N7515_005753 [Penicillium bovifimosum]KAJ5129714.1 hypothetical protein N7515_005753 [Penicillium bovifimosum]